MPVVSSSGIITDTSQISGAIILDEDVATTAAIARSKLATGTANQVVINSGTGAFSSEAALAVSRGGTALTGTPTNGQLPIGNGSGYTLAALTAGSNITVTNGAGSITVAASAGGTTVYGTAGPAFTWTNTNPSDTGGNVMGSSNAANSLRHWKTSATFTAGTQEFHFIGTTETATANKLPTVGFSDTWTARIATTGDSAALESDASGGGRYINARAGTQTQTAEAAFNGTTSHYEIRLNGATNVIYVDDGTTDATHTTNLPTAAMNAGISPQTAGTAPGSATTITYAAWWVQ